MKGRIDVPRKNIEVFTTHLNNLQVDFYMNFSAVKNDEKSVVFFSHSHTVPEIFTCTNGQIKIYTESNIFTLNSGDLLIVPANVLHTKIYEKDSEKVIWKGAYLDCKKVSSDETDYDAFSVFDRVLNSQQPTLISSEKASKIILKLTTLTDLDNKLIAKLVVTLCFELFLCFSELENKQHNAKTTNSKNNFSKILFDVEEILNSNTNVSNTEIAKAVNISNRQLSRLISDFYGMSLHKLKIKRRLDIATFMLKNNTNSIEEIAYKVGFNNKKSFYSQFKAAYGITPLQYRKQNKKES